MGRKGDSLQGAGDIIIAAIPAARVALQVGDATSEADVTAAADKAVDHGGCLDIVIPTVGGTSSLGGLLEMTKGGGFVFISSNAAIMAFPNLAGYCAGKAALEHFVRSAANDLGPMGIRLNAVRPGLTHTDGADAAFENEAYVAQFLPRFPLGRTGMPIDIATAVRFLAGPESSWVTGQSFAVDGGHELRGPTE
jgi:NAD(P)-dependent dehydrogenase (short-subunit alcohol dehydrogenase family)